MFHLNLRNIVKLWKRRNEAHDYFFEFIEKNNLKIKKFRFLYCKIINKFI